MSMTMRRVTVIMKFIMQIVNIFLHHKTELTWENFLIVQRQYGKRKSISVRVMGVGLVRMNVILLKRQRLVYVPVPNKGKVFLGISIIKQFPQQKILLKILFSRTYSVPGKLRYLRKALQTKMMGKLLLTLVLFCFSCKSNSQKRGGDSVYLCEGPLSYAYHLTSSCQGLRRCSTRIYHVSFEQAQKERRKLCRYCAKRREK